MAIQGLVHNRIDTGKNDGLANGQWQDATGLEVEDFVSRRLSQAIAKLSFNSETSELIPYNSDGEELERTIVINATPTYIPEIEFTSLRINSNNYDLKTGESIDLNQPSIVKIEAGIKLVVKYDILGKTYYGIDPQKVEFTLGNQTFVADKVIPNKASELDVVQFIDITDLFQTGVTNGTLTASCATKDYTASDSYDGAVTLRKIEISYTNKGYVEGKTMSFNISGINSGDLSKFQLVYYDNGSTSKNYVALNNTSKVDITLDTGTHQIYARIEYIANANLYYSNWVQTNIIIDCNNIQGDAVAVINSVPTEINNCSNALLYKICYASGTNGGDIIINSYISEDFDDVADESRKKDYILNSTTLSLMAGEEAGEKEFYSYFELETVSSTDARFMSFDINGETVMSYDGSAPDIVSYFAINIVENKYNINGAFNHTVGASLDFSQINGSGSNVFNADNTTLLPGDGWTVDGRYTAYQVSASEQELFKTPIDLSSSLNNGFTFEFLLKTYNVNSDDPVLKIGNLYVGPGYVRVNEDIVEGEEHSSSSIHVNSKADYGKEEITHVLVVYEKQYTPKTYVNIYDQLLTQGSVNYSSPGAVTPYDVLRIYVNGVINREIQVSEASLKRNGTFSLQIAPTSSDVRFYALRTYGFPFNYAQVQKNRISSLLDANAKKAYYDKNDILDANGRISLRKCINKYNVLVYAIPENDCPLFYGNKDVAGNEKSDTSVLVHYANPDWAKYNVKMWGGKYKAQGSSAKKYLIHNCQYNIKKGKCLSEADFEHNISNNLTEKDEGYIAPTNYYVMPESDIKAKKFVGKVNYASSMQTHKQGACDLFDAAYKAIFANNIDEKLPNGGRKAVFEKEFLYFYYNLKPGETLETITIKDTLDDAKFIGFQTWGPGKTDDPTYGYGDETPEYMLMEGADNGNAGANFKIPWAAFQTYDSTVANIGTQYIKQQPASVTQNDFITGLLIDDETIKFTSNDDPLDVDYGVEEYEGHYTEEINPVFTFTKEVKENSLPKFVAFYNAVYQYDFTCYLPMSEVVGDDEPFDVTNTYVTDKYPKGVTRYKLYSTKATITVTGDTAVTTAKRFDVFRWDPLNNKWVPAGLHMNSNNTTWDTFNLVGAYGDYQTTDLYQKYQSDMDTSKFGISIDTITTPTKLTQYVFPAMKDMFMAACKEYVDIEDIAYHQAVIRVLSGTDNRAKNTYFQIIGKIYTENSETGEFEKLEDAKGDYKIRLMQDDLDTIFATDNNGQQLKPYYLLEPPFNLGLEYMWGDNHSSFFYPFDLCYATKINEYTGQIVNYLLGSNSDLTSEGTNLYKHFLHIQQALPAIAYNHTAEIYYELAQTLYQSGNKLYEDSFGSLLPNYVNNSVPNPLSLSHGSNYEGEVQFLKNRLLMLASLTNVAPNFNTPASEIANAGTGDGNAMVKVSGNAKYLDYFYPNYNTGGNLNLLLYEQNEDGAKGSIDYDNLFANLNVFPNSVDKIVVQSLAIPGNLYNFTLSGQKLTGITLANSDKYEYLEVTEGLQFLISLPRLLRAKYLIIDGAKTQYSITATEVSVYDSLPVIEELHLTNTTFNNTVLDFRNCNRLKVLDLSGCTGIASVILPEGEKLKEVYLPACLKSLAVTNNPRLEKLELESGTDLEALTLNVNQIGTINVSDLIETYFDFSNAQLLKLTGSCNLSLIVVDRLSTLGSKCDLRGTYTIMDGESKADISYQLKKNLVISFGNIDSEDNKVYFDYTPSILVEDSKVYEQLIYGCNYVAGSENIFYPFDSIYFKKGNDIVIREDGTLDITYKCSAGSSIALLDSETGKLILYKNGTSNYTYSVTFNSKRAGSITVSGEIYFGYRAPEVGDFAYADGTFAKSYINTKTLVGLVYAKRTNPEDVSKIDLAILSNKTVTGVIAPDHYAYDGSFYTENDWGMDQRKVYDLLQSSVFVGKSFIPTDANITTYEGYNYSPYSVTAYSTLPAEPITKDYDTTGFPETSGKTNTYTYKNIANRHLNQLAIADTANFGKDMQDKGYMTSGYKVIEGLSGDDYDWICTKFNSRAGAVVPSGSVAQGPLSSGNTYAQLIYPAFYKVCLFQPETTGTLVDAYKAGNWYVPSIDEMSMLIAHRIKSVTTATQASDSVADWYGANQFYTGNGIFTETNKAHFGGFLNDLKDTSGNFAYITSNVVDSKNAVYTKTTLWGTNTATGWKAAYYYNSFIGGYLHYATESFSCRRDRSYTVPMCCQITVNNNG